MKLIMTLDVPKADEQIVRDMIDDKADLLLADYLETATYNGIVPTAVIKE